VIRHNNRAREVVVEWRAGMCQVWRRHLSKLCPWSSLSVRLRPVIALARTFGAPGARPDPAPGTFTVPGTHPGGPVKWFVAFLRKVSITWADLSFQISSGSALRSRAGAFFLTITPADSL
jgi:hypothetical protein